MTDIKPWPSYANATPHRQRGSPRRILVVHDDTDMRQLSTEVLKRSGYEVEDAADCTAAWQALSTDHYDLLVADYQMPRVSGVTLIDQLRAARIALPVILTTAMFQRAESSQKPSLQPTTALLMPYTVAEFLGTVQNVLAATDRARESANPDRK